MFRYHISIPHPKPRRPSLAPSPPPPPPPSPSPSPSPTYLAVFVALLRRLKLFHSARSLLLPRWRRALIKPASQPARRFPPTVCLSAVLILTLACFIATGTMAFTIAPHIERRVPPACGFAVVLRVRSALRWCWWIQLTPWA